MASRIHGPLYFERAGRTGPGMVFVHPNPMDASCWMFQMAHFSTWYRCVAVDLPGYGRSPAADPGLTMDDLAEACWQAIDDAVPDGPAVLVGCSVGAAIVPYMCRQQPERTAAMVLTGSGYLSEAARPVLLSRIDAYAERGADFRWAYTFEDFSAAFQSSPTAHYFAAMFAERNHLVDVPTVMDMYRALVQPVPDDMYDMHCPALVVGGSEDAAVTTGAAAELARRIAGSDYSVIPGAGHACYIEQPGLFDRIVLEFLERHELLPERGAGNGKSG